MLQTDVDARRKSQVGKIYIYKQNQILLHIPSLIVLNIVCITILSYYEERKFNWDTGRKAL